jgi:hypothetical protein
MECFWKLFADNGRHAFVSHGIKELMTVCSSALHRNKQGSFRSLA